MKHILNNLDSSEKNTILEQYNNSIIVETKKFNKLISSKLGTIKPLLENTTQTGESLRWAINDDTVLYFPNVTTIEGRKDKKGNVRPNTKPGLQGKFIKGPGLLYFNRDYNVGGVQLNYDYDYSNPIEINKDDCIIGNFDKGGLISGSLYKSLGPGIFNEPAWDEEHPIELDLNKSQTQNEY